MSSSGIHKRWSFWRIVSAVTATALLFAWLDPTRSETAALAVLYAVVAVVIGLFHWIGRYLSTGHSA